MIKKIIITGGLGYIGTELCKIYSGVSWHHKITVIDNRFISERVNQIRNWNMEFIQGDILDKKIVQNYYTNVLGYTKCKLHNPKKFLYANQTILQIVLLLVLLYLFVYMFP